jgi:hypothetical protein
MCDAYVVMFGLARAKIKFIIVWDPSRVVSRSRIRVCNTVETSR